MSSRVRKRVARRRQRRAPEHIARLLRGEDDEAAGTTAEAPSATSPEDPSSPPSGTENAPIAEATNETNGANQTESSGTENAPDVNVIVLLEGANLELTKARTGGMTLLNSEEHTNVLRKSGRTANDARPDITHQCLLALMDSPLNKAGRLKVFVRSARNVLIEVHPEMRVPRTARRFYGLMAELLSKFKVRGTAGSQPLLRVVRNPMTSHLPVGCRRVVCTYNSENVQDIRKHARKMSAASQEDTTSGKRTVLYVVGAIAHGKVEEEWAEENVCISEYPLSAATVCSRITYAYECLHGIL